MSRPGLRAMLHAWSHVQLRDDDEWLGPAPAERAHELKFIEEFGEQWKAAAKIQSIVRGRRARRLADNMRRANLMQWVVTKMQARYKGRKMKRAYVIVQMQRRHEHEVVTKLQARVVECGSLG